MNKNKKGLKLNVFDRHRYVKNACLIAVVAAGLVGSGSLPQISKGTAGYKLAVGNVAMAASSNSSDQSVESVKVKKIVSGSSGYSSFYLKTDGTVWACGLNAYGQLGIGDTNDRNMPEKADISNVADVISDQGTYNSSEYSYMYFLKTDGTVWICGGYKNTTINTPRQVNISNVAKVVNSDRITYFIKTDGTVWACEQGLINYINQVSYLSNVADVIPNSYNTLFLKTDGTVWACGSNCYGELGVGNTKDIDSYSPTQVNISNVANVISDGYRTFFIKTDGTVWACGLNDYGQLGLGDRNNRTTPTQVNISNVTNVASNGSTYFIKTDGTIWACGYNGQGQLGLGDRNDRTTPTQVNISNVTNVTINNGTYFLKTDGTVWAPADNYSGQLELVESNIDKVSISGNGTYFLKTDGTVWAYGQNTKGELGVGDTIRRTTPTLLRVLSYGANYVVDNIYNLDDVQKYGSWFTGFYGKSVIDNNEFMNFNLSGKDGTSKMHAGGIIQNESSIRGKYFLDNGVMILIDNYGMVQYYKDFNTTNPDTLSIDGDSIDHVGTLIFGNGTIKTVLYMKDGSLKYVDTDESIHDMTLKQSDIVKTFAYKYANGQSQKMLIQKPDGSLVYLDASGNVQNFGINMNDVAYTLQSTDVNKDIFVMKGSTITLKDDTGNIDLPSGLTINKIWSNRIFEMSDGFLYTLQNGSFKKTTTLAKIASLAQNQALLLKNGNFQTVDGSGNLNNFTAINGANVSFFSQLDSTNQYVIMKDGTTYGIGTNVQGDKLENHGIDINHVSAMISNGSTNVSKVLVMDDGTLYVNQYNGWMKNTYVKLGSTAVSDANKQNPVIVDPSTTDPTKYPDKFPGGDTRGDASKGDAQKPADTTAPTITVTGNPTSWTKGSITLNVSASDETNGSGLDSIILPDNTTVTGGTATFNVTANGTYTFKAKDKAGNIATQTVTVDKLDNTAPGQPTITQTPNGFTVVDGTDSESGVKEVDVNIDNTGWKTSTGTETLPLADHTVQAKSIDNVGNESTIVTQSVNLLQQAEKDASDAVDKAVNSGSQSDLDNAKKKVDSLPDGQTKTDLEKKIADAQKNADYAKQLATATNAVVKAEGSKVQADVDSARILVNALNTSDKAALGARLDTVQKAIDNASAYTAQLATATNAVVKAEGSKVQADVDSARTLVNALNTSDKATLGARLDTVQKAIDNASVYAKQLAEATNAVVKAEGSKTQADVDSARTLVNALNTSDKATLGARLDTVQNAIDNAKAYATQLATATTAVTKAEGSKLQADVDSARTLVNALNTEDKTTLGARLDTVQKAIDSVQSAAEKAASDAVDKAIKSGSQSDLDNAKKIVDALPDSSTKTDLQKQISDEQKAIDKAQAKQAQADQKFKTDILTALNNLNLQLAYNTNPDTVQKSLDLIKEKVNAMPDGPDKDQLLAKIQEIQDKIDKKKAVNTQKKAVSDLLTKAQTTLSSDDIQAAEDAINALPANVDKASYNIMLRSIKQNAVMNSKSISIQASNAVIKASNTKRPEDIQAARDLLSKLPSSSFKDQLEKVLDTIENPQKTHPVSLFEQIRNAENLVTKAQISKDSSDIASAQAAVTALPDGNNKTALQSKLNTIAKQINASSVQKASSAVTWAEFYCTKDYYDKAVQLVNNLPAESQTSLTARLNAVKPSLDAVEAVNKALTTKDSTDIQTAKDLVSKLQNGRIKNQLNLKIKNLK